MIFSIGFPTNTRADNCPLFSETFSGTSGHTWTYGLHGTYAINNGRFELTLPESGYFSYGETGFMPTGFFTIDTDVTVTPQSANSKIGIYTFTTGDVLFSISNVATDGFAAFYYPQTSQVNFMYWDVSAGAWISTQNQAVTGPVTSIGMKVLSDRVVFRVNRADTAIILPGIFTMPEVIDSLWLMASGSYSLASFDNVCAFLNSTPPTPTPTPTPTPQPGFPPPVLSYNISNNNLTINWTAVQGATGYLLSAGTQPSNYIAQNVDMKAATSLPIPLASIPNGIYYLAAKAYNSTQTSGYSNEIVVVIGSPALYAPHDLRYTLNNNQVTIQWNPVAGATGYKIFLGLRPGEYTSFSDVKNNILIGPADISGLPPGTYYLAVKAYSSAGESDYSNEINVKSVAGNLTISPTSVIGGATGSYTSKTDGKPVAFTVTPSVSDGSVTATISKGSDILTVRTDTTQASINWKGVTLDGYGSLSVNEKQAIQNLAASGLAEALAMIPLNASCGTVDLDLASAQALLLPWQLILKYTSCNPPLDARTMADRSVCDYFSGKDAAKAPKIILLSENDPIPHVFGSWPLDEIGAFSNDAAACPASASALEIEHRRTKDQDISTSYLSALGILPEALTPSPLVQSQKSPCGSKCRDACGADCEPWNCVRTLLYECASDGITLVEWEKQDCGVHTGCINHDTCYDDCDNYYHCAKDWGTQGWSNSACHRKCDGKCLAEYCKKCAVSGFLGGGWALAGCLAANCDCTKWAIGKGTFEYRQDYYYITNPTYGKCVTVNCSDTTISGGDAADTQIIKLGKNAGTFTFDYETYSVPDQIQVLDEGGAVLFDTGCVGANGSKQITYSGTKGEITVKVTPNCTGTTGTSWNYTVHCPK